jgi:hypothetical protein
MKDITSHLVMCKPVEKKDEGHQVHEAQMVGEPT